MKTARKFISVLLVLLLSFGMLPTSILAEQSDVVTYAVTGGNLYFNPSTGTITDCDSSVTEAVIPDEINGVPVTSIGSYAFNGCSSLTSITIPDSVTSIGDFAFEECSSLTSITIPDGVTSIGSFAFSECSGLTSITIPDSVTSIGDFAFEECSGLTSITIPDGVTSISNGAFKECSSLTSITIPDGVTSIGSYAFSGCSGLTSITIPDVVTSIGDSAFSGCSGLTSIRIPDGVTEIGESTFEGCSGLTSIRIPDVVTSIGDSAFSGCSGLTSIRIPDGVTEIGESTFKECSGLTSIRIPDGVTEIGESTFEGCSSLANVTIPGGVTSIGDYAFSRCSRLTSITIPNGVTSIGDSAFRWCSRLTSITIPDGVTSIGSYAFFECGNLTDVYYGGNEADWQAISVEFANWNLLDATIHYNSTGSNEADGSDPVSFFRQYNSETNQIFFDDSQLAYSLSEDADLSFLSDLDHLLGKYVLVEEGNNLFEVKSIKPVESKTGTVTDTTSAVGDLGMLHLTSMTIDGITYDVDENSFLYLDVFENIEILYHLYDGKIVAFQLLRESTGVLNRIDSDKKELIIDGNSYPIPDYSKVTIDDVVTMLRKNVVVKHDKLNHVFHIEVNEPEAIEVPEDFNIDIYRADWLQDKTDITVSYIHDLLSKESPSKDLVVELQKKGFDDVVNVWSTFELLFDSFENPSAIAEFTFKPKDIYMALLMEALETSVSYDVFYDSGEDALKQVGKFVSTLQKTMKQKFNIDLYSNKTFQQLSGKERETFLEESRKWFDENFKGKYVKLSLSNEIWNALSLSFDIMGSIEDYFERVASCMMIAELSENMKDVVRQAYQDSRVVSDIYLQAALLECVGIINSSTEELMLKITNDGFVAVGTNVMKVLIGECWSLVTDSIYAACPAVAVFQQAYKVGKYVSNLAFNTDSTVEKYLDMLMLSHIEDLIDYSVLKLNNQFLAENTIENAGPYLSGIDLMFQLRDMSAKTAYEFVDVLDSSFVNNLLNDKFPGMFRVLLDFLFGKSDYSDQKSYYQMLQKDYFLGHENALTRWIDWLDEDYPNTGLYEKYQYLLKQSNKRILKKKYVAACPVDVYVYNAKNELIASVEGERVSCSGDVTIVKENDTKTVYFYGDEEYRIEYVGNAEGEMDVSILEFDDNETLSRTVSFYDVPLSTDLTYSVDATPEILVPDGYQLQNDQETVLSDYDSLSSDTSVYQASIVSGAIMSDNDLVLSLEASANQTFDILAYVPENAEFVKWSSNYGEDIFEDPLQMNTSVRMPASDVVITAVLQTNEVAVTGIQITPDHLNLKVSESAILNTEISPSNATNQKVNWSSENTAVATVNEDSLVTAIASGNTTIHAVTEDGGYTAQCTIVVSDSISEENYTVTYTDGVEGEEVFADQVFENLPAGTKTPVFNGTPVRNGYEFTGWAPTVTETVTSNVTYIAQWKEKTEPTEPTEPVEPTEPTQPVEPTEPTQPVGPTIPNQSNNSINSSALDQQGNLTDSVDAAQPDLSVQVSDPIKPDSSENQKSDHTSDSPQTGDNSNLLFWILLLIVSGAGLTAILLHRRKKRG